MVVHFQIQFCIYQGQSGLFAFFKIVLSPTAVVKFDTWIQVNIRGWKTIDLRMGGTVEPPEVDIDIKVAGHTL